jgi:hypothetical protein
MIYMSMEDGTRDYWNHDRLHKNENNIYEIFDFNDKINFKHEYFNRKDINQYFIIMNNTVKITTSICNFLESSYVVYLDFFSIFYYKKDNNNRLLILPIGKVI